MSAAPRPLRVADVVTESGAWDWERLGAMLPREKLDLIASIQPLQSDFGVDTSRWGMDYLICDSVLAPLETSVSVVVRPGAKRGRGLSMDHIFFTLAPVDIANLVEKEQEDSYPISAMPLTIAQKMRFDPGG
ncbi:hypothetical protein V6N11_074101 [Hibiscus sabdariffa]|uniref:Uncharacterized protein n=1 Tax=Hibiscus sabdariffa TaxID=183260 RepID=A0ABR1ZXN2_9ROSI